MTKIKKVSEVENGALMWNYSRVCPKSVPAHLNYNCRGRSWSLAFHVHLTLGLFLAETQSRRGEKCRKAQMVQERGSIATRIKINIIRDHPPDPCLSAFLTDVSGGKIMPTIKSPFPSRILKVPPHPWCRFYGKYFYGEFLQCVRR